MHVCVYLCVYINMCVFECMWASLWLGILTSGCHAFHATDLLSTTKHTRARTHRHTDTHTHKWEKFSMREMLRFGGKLLRINFYISVFIIILERSNVTGLTKRIVAVSLRMAFKGKCNQPSMYCGEGCAIFFWKIINISIVSHIINHDFPTEHYSDKIL